MPCLSSDCQPRRATLRADLWESMCNSENTVLNREVEEVWQLTFREGALLCDSSGISGITKAIVKAQYEVFIRDCCSHC